MRHIMRWNVLGITLLSITLLAIVVLGGGGWYYSSVLEDGAFIPDHADPVLDLEIVSIDQGVITLRPGPDSEADGPWTESGIWGLELEDAYHRVGEIFSIGADAVVREFISLGDLPTVGQMARMDSYSFPDDPETAHGVRYKDVSILSPIDAFPAWYITGNGNMWAIFVHGQGAKRQEALRMLPTMVAAGFPSLIITYRNDKGMAASADGYYRFGETEWEDLEAAIQYALNQGANDVILVGYSMGGAIVLSTLSRSPLASNVAGIILDAPMLDFNATVNLGARQRGVPGAFTALGKAIAAVRFDIDWDAVNYLRRIDEIMVPTLLFHGDADTKVPVETSDSFAESFDLVTYVRVPNASHVRSWNTDPAGYAEAVLRFLNSISR
ncbi:alpha/beta hydrolase [Dehalococcoidia bacterium]|nr:alpha/beta hydrolase [Dehalococcoidia bacterium]